MGEIYILIAIGPEGARCAQTMTPEVPEDFVRPGEIAFIVVPIDIKTKHDHLIEKSNIFKEKEGWGNG